ncbi:hypothetical protein [Arcticibacterium luteifluviistationis]|uniref:Addiction module protein n=1 Tax=Arcticibacterium luteifluviistationis TaxID=1784714 RepID=A0A2Z4GI21_9BACT|nr:hypothetical protein [Arcticibacterium luteifluviistationis]AWW00665.1 hypothetical protein DJ013_21745 [Arcticibacterium luteifluviistationis]
MDIQTSKIELVKEILNLENPSLIQRMFDLLKSEEKDAFELTEIEAKEIQIGIEQFDRGEGIKWDDFLKSIS